MALNNFKVTISRLRGRVESLGGARLNWLVVAEGRVSLVKSACSVVLSAVPGGGAQDHTGKTIIAGTAPHTGTVSR